MTINTVAVQMDWNDIPNIRETVTITPMSDIQQDPAKGMAHIIAKDALGRTLRYMGVLAAGSVLMSLLAAAQTYQDIQHEMDQQDQQISRLKGETHYGEGTSTFYTQGDAP